MGEDSKNNPFLAFYAYRAFLANFFWDQILWQQLNLKKLQKSLILVLLLFGSLLGFCRIFGLFSSSILG